MKERLEVKSNAVQIPVQRTFSAFSQCQFQ